MSSVLVVDENQDSRFVLRSLLESAGLEVWAEPNAVAAQRRCEAEGHGPDLAIVDLILSDPNGFDLPCSLRIRYPYMPLILISGTPLEMLVLHDYADPTAVEPYVFLEKPFTAQSFREKLEDALAILSGGRRKRAEQG